MAEVAKEKEAKEVAKKDDKPKGTMPQRVWATVKKEAAHYWAGTKLLGQEIKISSKLQWKVLNGGTLTRRERRQASLLYAIVTSAAELTWTAQAYNHRFDPPRTILCLCPGALHGVFAPCRAQALPQHAA